MIISRTPFRISFFGGGTDYPIWYREHGGAVLATAIDKYCYINCRFLPPFFEHRSRIVYTKVENVQHNADIQHPAVRACLEHLGIEEGVEIHHDADLPARSGLGTSSSFVVGLLKALHALKQDPAPDARGLAREAVNIEQSQLRENVGVQDQITAAHGGFNHVCISRGGEIDVRPVVVAADRLDQLQRHLLLYFTGFSRTASDIAQEQIANTRNRHTELTDLGALVSEGLEVVTSPRRDLSEFGALLDTAWQIKRTLSTRVSNSSLDAIYERARADGAIGGKLLGAGGGGFMIFFVPPDAQPRFCESMRHLLRVPFRFAALGAQLVVDSGSTQFDPALGRERERVYAQRI